jgi:hypothetical protein
VALNVLLTAPVSEILVDQLKQHPLALPVNVNDNENLHADPKTLINVERLLIIHMIDMLVRVGAKTDGRNCCGMKSRSSSYPDS